MQFFQPFFPPFERNKAIFLKNCVFPGFFFNFLKRKIIQNFPSKKNKFWQHWEIVTIIYVKIDESEICYRSLVPTIRFLGEKNNCEFFFLEIELFGLFFMHPVVFSFAKVKIAEIYLHLVVVVLKHWKNDVLSVS